MYHVLEKFHTNDPREHGRKLYLLDHWPKIFSMFIYFYTLMYLCIYPFIYLFTFLYVYIFLYICVSMYLLIDLATYIFTCLCIFIHLCIYLLSYILCVYIFYILCILLYSLYIAFLIFTLQRFATANFESTGKVCECYKLALRTASVCVGYERGSEI